MDTDFGITFLPFIDGAFKPAIQLTGGFPLSGVGGESVHVYHPRERATVTKIHGGWIWRGEVEQVLPSRMLIISLARHMSESLNLVAAVVPSSQRQILRAFGEEVHLRLTGEQTGGRQTLWTEITPPGGGPPPHYHSNADETFYVIEGHVSFFKDGQWQEVTPGSAAYMPRGVVHTFRNVGQTPLRMLVSTSPSGFETFFAKCAEEFAKSGSPDMERIMAISAEHGIHFVEP
jgi:quercetin dioxygenase-like cupin family protein